MYTPTPQHCTKQNHLLFFFSVLFYFFSSKSTRSGDGRGSGLDVGVVGGGGVLFPSARRVVDVSCLRNAFQIFLCWLNLTTTNATRAQKTNGGGTMVVPRRLPALGSKSLWPPVCQPCHPPPPAPLSWL